jgi:transposase
MDLSELYATYDRIRKNQATPRQMLKIMLYASMNRLFSSRDIETACKRDVNFMYLLEGMPAPDHATIVRFISLHLSSCPKKILTNVTSILHDLGEISGKTIFIDGTKIESCANKYTFVWKKSVTKHQARLFEKIVSFSYLWKEEQLFQDRSGCDIHAPERRCHAEGAAEASL